MHTGMRAGEIQALTVDDLGEDEIYVRCSWSKYDDLKCCKNGEERSVPIPISHQLYLKLKMLADFNPHVNGFDKSRPIIVTEAYIIVDGHSRFLTGVQLWTPVKRTSQDYKRSVS